MKQGADIQKELTELGSSLRGMSQAMPYSVPKGYFDQLDVRLLETISDINAEGKYREAGTAAACHAVPEGYFTQLPATMLALAKGKSPAVTQKGKAKGRTMALRSVSMATAAALILTIGLGAYIYLFNQNDSGAEQMLSAVPNNALHEYLQNTYPVDVDRVVNNDVLKSLQLDNSDIIKYLDETGWDVID